MGADRFPFRTIGASMRNGVQPVRMLVDGWLPGGAIVWMSSEPEAGKTWICLWLAAQAISAGHRVAYIDAELGEPEIAKRLLLLGCDAAVIDANLVYLDFPSWSLSDAEAWDAACAEHAWDLVVFETASDFLADAGLNENDGLDVTEWVKAFPERVVVHGGTALVSDHVRKDGITNGYAVGSRAKKAKTKLGLEVRVVQAYDADRPGAITVDRTKNTLSAPVPKQRRLAIGPLDGKGTFDIREATQQAAATDTDPIVVMADLLCAELFDGGHVSQAAAVSQNTLIGLVGGNRKLKIDAAQLAATSPAWPVHSFAHGANAIRYYATGRERSIGTPGTGLASTDPVLVPTSPGAQAVDGDADPTFGQPVPSNTGTGPGLVGTGSRKPIPDPSIGSGIGTDPDAREVES